MFPSLKSLETTRWLALQQRDKSAHSLFIYAVLTTRIFCRPTCPARLARRANIIFFDTAIDATIAGFRACKRCKPSDESDIDGVSPMVTRACEYVMAKQGCVSTGEIAGIVGISVTHLYGMFRKAAGCSPTTYAARVRENSREKEAGGSFGRNQTEDQSEIQHHDVVDYCSPSAYADIEMWTWQDDDEFLVVTDASGSTASPNPLTPAFAGSPSYQDWMSSTSLGIYYESDAMITKMESGSLSVFGLDRISTR